VQKEPTIGIICDHKSLLLAGRLIGAGYRLVRVLPENLVPGAMEDTDAWVVDCSDNALVADAMAWIEQEVLVLSNRPQPSDLVAYSHWCDRIIRTLDKWSADFWHANSTPTQSVPEAYSRVQGVWVLAGSSGGVNAVSEFFAAFTHVPPIAFVYAQHIRARQQAMLTAVGNSRPELCCSLAVGRHWLNPGHVLIVPAACRLEFTKQGQVVSVRDQWGTSETPNIDQLMLTMSGMTPSPAGAIIFSGTGKDGSEGLRALQAVGTRIWAQDPASAVSPSMPQTAIDLGLVAHSATPAALGAAFMRLYPSTKPRNSAISPKI
jgi:chemotaxis response regulator CheB